MKITPSAADRFVSTRPANVDAVLVYGPDRGLARERAERLLATTGVSRQDPFAFTDLSDDDLKSDPARLNDEMRAMAFGGGGRAVRLRLSGDAAAGAIADLLKELDSGALETTAFLVAEAGELTPRSKVRKAFEAATRAAALACYADSAADLARIAPGILSEYGLSIAPDALERLVPFLEGDRAHARMELEKLALYAGLNRSEPITVEEVDASASAGDSTAMDDIVMAAADANRLEADTQLARALEAGVSAVAICRAYQRHLMRLDLVRASVDQGRSVDEAMRALRPPPFGFHRNAFKRQVGRWSGRALSTALERALTCETQLKSTGSADTALIGRLTLAVAQLAGRR